MPVDSEASTAALPHTWRPFGVAGSRSASSGHAVRAASSSCWIGARRGRAASSPAFQRGTLVFLALLLLATYNALWRSRVTATTDRLTVVNGYRTRRLRVVPGDRGVPAAAVRRGRRLDLSTAPPSRCSACRAPTVTGPAGPSADPGRDREPDPAGVDRRLAPPHAERARPARARLEHDEVGARVEGVRRSRPAHGDGLGAGAGAPPQRVAREPSTAAGRPTVDVAEAYDGATVRISARSPKQSSMRSSPTCRSEVKSYPHPGDRLRAVEQPGPLVGEQPPRPRQEQGDRGRGRGRGASRRNGVGPLVAPSHGSSPPRRTTSRSSVHG